MADDTQHNMDASAASDQHGMAGADRHYAERITLRLKPATIKDIDTLVDQEKFPSRSEAIRQGIEDLLENHNE